MKPGDAWSRHRTGTALDETNETTRDYIPGRGKMESNLRCGLTSEFVAGVGESPIPGPS